MIYEALTRKYPMILAAIVFVGLFAAGICLAAEDTGANTDTDTSSESSFEIPKRVQEEIIKVDELSKEEKEKLEAVKRQQYLDNFHDEPAGNLLSEKDINRIERQKEERENALIARAKAQAEPNLASTSNPPEQVRPRLPAKSYKEGTVTGILFYMEKGAALVLGDVVREGDVIRGVTVVRIMPNYVEFEKQGNIWKQIVGQTPPADVWKNPKTQH
jgi:hypothetical protein